MDGLGRTYGNTLAADAALVEVDVRHVVLNGDGTKRTLLLTLAATNTCSLAGLHGSRTLVLVDAADIDTTVLWSFLTQLDDVTRTSLDTSATRGTLLFIDLGETSLGIHVDSVELAGSDTVATTQTTKTASGLTSAA